MTPEQQDEHDDAGRKILGVLWIVFALFGAGYIGSAFIEAISNGYSKGRLGAVNLAGTSQYAVYLIACLFGLALMATLVVLGIKWAGFFRRPSKS